MGPEIGQQLHAGVGYQLLRLGIGQATQRKGRQFGIVHLKDQIARAGFPRIRQPDPPHVSAIAVGPVPQDAGFRCDTGIVLLLRMLETISGMLRLLIGFIDSANLRAVPENPILLSVRHPHRLPFRRERHRQHGFGIESAEIAGPHQARLAAFHLPVSGVRHGLRFGLRPGLPARGGWGTPLPAAGKTAAKQQEQQQAAKRSFHGFLLGFRAHGSGCQFRLWS